MADIELTYFDFDGGRGEDCRLALHIAGVPFTDDRVKGTWAERKPTTPFGHLPVLRIDGRTLWSSNAILGYIGETWGLLPDGPWERARHRALMDEVEELRKGIERTARPDEADRLAARAGFAEGPLLTWLQCTSRQLGDGPFFAGDAVGVADLKLYVALRALRRGVFDGIPTTVIDDFPALLRLLDAVAEHPGVKGWYEARAAG